MTDARYTFVTDVRDKARTARGARAKLSGARTQYCGLPSDRLSESERKRRNGEVKTYNLREPMSWAEFKNLPNDLKQEYLAKLSAEFNATQKDISAMLGVSSNNMSTYASKHFPAYRFPSGNRTVKDKWARFLAGTYYDADTETEAALPTTASDTPTPSVAPAVRTTPTHYAPAILPETGELIYSGSGRAICQALFDLLGTGDFDLVDIRFERKVIREPDNIATEEKAVE